LRPADELVLPANGLDRASAFVRRKSNQWPPKRCFMKAALLASILTMLMVSFIPAVLAADDSSDSPPATSATAAQGVDVRTIIASVSQRTHKTFLVDPRVAATVHLDGTSFRDVTYPLLLTILAVHAFAVYEQEGVVVVTPDANERFFPSRMVKPDEIRAPDAEIVTTLVDVKKAPELVTILRPLIATNAQVNAFADRNAVIIVDRAANVRRIVAIIRELDKLPVFKAE
jgi:general secretion pathway protein D